MEYVERQIVSLLVGLRVTLDFWNPIFLEYFWN